jgi:uncharacterized membrane protein YcaP (DUF421 family)
MFVLDAEKATYLEKIVRPILVYFILLFLFRLLGNRELAQLNPMDLILLLLLSNTVQNAIIGDDTSLVGGIVGAVALLGINYFNVWAKYRSKSFEKFMEGSPRKLIENGKLDKEAIEKELLTKEDLDTLAHEQGFDSSDDIEKCVLDTNGTFLVEGKDEIKDEKFKREILKKIDKITEQLNDLQKQLKKS